MIAHTINSIQTFQNLSPLIILGMHRSGTSLITRLLADCGIFPGRKLSINAESIFFRNINEKIYRCVGATWSYINPICEAMESNEFVSNQVKMIKTHLFDSMQIEHFFIPEHWIKLQDGKVFNWGWKDPRTTITFPIWLKIFPKARFLSVKRNGIDVAISLHRRALKHNQLWKRFSPIHNYSKRMFALKECLNLWAEHLEFELKKQSLIPDGNFLEIEYENLLTNPVSMLKNILEFAGVSYHKKDLESISVQINIKRIDNSRFVHQFRNDIEPLLDHPILRQFGYAEKTKAYFRD
ncbi:sulfotransferase [bacterium]|nr:sulfotransferase [bacterium]